MVLEPSRSDRVLEQTSAAVLVFYACAQIAQEFILAHAPPASDVVANFAFDLSLANRFRLIALFPCFCAMPAIYAAAHRRLRPDAWALAGAGGRWLDRPVHRFRTGQPRRRDRPEQVQFAAAARAVALALPRPPQASRAAPC
jgi:hypothetical protein